VSQTLNGPFRISFDEHITAIESIEPSEDLPLISTGLVESHCHGGSGFSMNGTAESVRGLLQHTKAHGASSNILSMVSMSTKSLAETLNATLPMVGKEGFLGLHLEGPYLADSRCGAHDIQQLRDLGEAELELIIHSRAVRSITIAPERVSLEQVSRLSHSGIVVGIGHTDADYHTALDYFAAGATLLTHAFNAMPQIKSREPGPVIAALDASVWIELIADGVHVQPALARQLATWAGEKLILVSDSMGAAGQPDGQYKLGDVSVIVDGGVARRADNGLLAGSTLTIDKAVSNLVSWGLSPLSAIAAASTNPAKCYNLPQPQISIGSEPDLLTWGVGRTGLEFLSRL
jgi:N-acetylglucosamine-6-phosphate deacetylase